MRRKAGLKGQKGQVTIEAVLLGVLIMIVGLQVSGFMKSNGTIRRLISGPWVHLRGMAEHGVWAPPEQAKLKHPNLSIRRGTVQGER